MEIVGYGIDVVDLRQFEMLLAEPDGDMLMRCFTAGEQAAATAYSANRLAYLAGRYAVKESVAKAMRCGFDGSVGPVDIEVANDSSGTPVVILHGAAASLAGELHISTWHISISHAGAVAIAGALAIRS